MSLVGLGLLAAAGWGGAIGPVHPNSYSISEIHVRGRTARVELRVQVLSLGEVIEGFDSDLDGHAEDGEIEANEAAILEYIHAHYRLMAGPATDGKVIEPSEALPIGTGVVSEGPLALDPMNEVSEWVDVVLEYDVPEAGEFRALGVVVDLFADTSPGHNDSAAVTWNGIELGPWMFNAAASGHLFEATDEMLARNAPAFGRFFEESLSGAAARWQLGLLTALLVVGAAGALASPLLSVGLLALALGAGVALGHLVPPRFELEGFVGLAVPLALAYMALDDLIHRAGQTRLLEPLVFGVLAGLGVSLEIAPAVGTELEQHGARLGAGLGLAVACLAVAGVALLLSVATRRGAQPDAFAPRPVRALASIPALAVGGWTLVQLLMG